MTAVETIADVLVRLTAKRDRLAAELAGVEGAIAALRAAMAAPPSPDAPAEAPAAPEPPPPDLPKGPYAGLAFYDAAAAYLAAAGEPKTTSEVADALIAGGYLTFASNFRASARTMLGRAESASAAGIYRTADGTRWCLRAPAPAATS